MGFKCGIVGLPNVGKSTVFNALTRAQVAAANYPFCTIDPNVGMVPVVDKRLHKIADLVKPKRVLPAVVEFVDIAGLVKGAAKGEGLGNKFLANIRETQAIAHVVRCFEDSDIVHVAGKVNPEADVETINTELILADIDTIDRVLSRLSKVAKVGNREVLAEIAALEQVRRALDQGVAIRLMDNLGEWKKYINPLALLTAKPILYIANVDEKHFYDNPYLHRLRELALKEKARVVTICATIESELASLSDEDREIFLADLGLAEPGLDRVVRAGYDILGLQTYFTAGVQEVRAWTIVRGAKAPEAAGVIHSDFARGFICAEVISYDDYVGHGGEQGAKEHGKLRMEGKEYIMRDGDIVHFRFNV